ncbi:DUF11 multi-domain protein [Kitasatospora sp. MMS16-BH015]|uniref:DUF11 domain-containing protein n=1 Tax=Kitasatospora sp. MMS16-BH015 TaxID=2018025 RepID=UPI000CA16D7D|nr:DUF11 domain-containing protein [Kitasatospora sp. MMS16-BH015]AUG81585.1 DUF11 multi-domain protein [Kitasatospora sp. MMS16-BH015]
MSLWPAAPAVAALPAVAPGETFTYTLSSRNAGPSVARNVMVHDTLPAGITFVSSDDGCTAVGQKVSCGPVDLAVGVTKSWSILVRLSPSYEGDGSDLGNVASTNSDANDPAQANNTNPPVRPDGPFDRKSDLSTTKTGVGTGPVVAGQQFEYLITTKNSGPSDAPNAMATDKLPAAISFVSSADGCTATGQTVTCGPVKTLAAGSSTSWKIKVQLASSYRGDGTDLKNTATSKSDAADPDPSNNTSKPADPPGGLSGPEADLSVVKKAATDTPVAPGETFDYRITTTNRGPSDATVVTATDKLPAMLGFVSSPDGCTAAGATVTCGPQPSLGAGDSLTWTIKVKIAPGYRGDGSDILNTATVGSATKDPVPANNTSAAAGPPGAKVNPPTADLGITKKAVGTTPPTPGATFDYLITIVNNGPSADAYNVTLADKLPVELRYVSSTPAGCTETGSVVSCTRSTPLKVGESEQYVLTVRLDAAYRGDGKNLKNSAKVTADNIDPRTDNDTSTADLPGGGAGTPSADVSTAKETVTTTPVAPGETFQYAVTATDNGPSDALNVVLRDTLPAQLAFVSSDDGCTAVGKAVTCGPAAIASGTSHRWVFTVQLDPAYVGNGSDIRNIATATSDTQDPNPDNNTSNPAGPPGNLVKTPEADLVIDKKPS